jgi:siderophore-iron reductase FhuF
MASEPPGERPPELRRIPAPEVVAAVRRAGAANPLLGIAVEPGSDSGQRSVGWSATSLCDPDGGAAVREVVAAVGRRVAPQDRSIAASMTVLGYAARLVGPAVAVLVRDDLLLDLAPERITCRFDEATGFTLTVRDPWGWRGPRAVLLERWRHEVLDRHLDGVIRGVRATVPVATRLLWGNVASGLTGALAALAAAGDVAPRTGHATGLALLDHPRLADSGRLELAAGRLRFTRRTCCLYYRLPGGGTCGDCPLPR